MATARNQPSYDFLTGGDAPSPGRSKARPHEAFRQSQALPQSLPVEDLHARIRTLEYQIATLKQEKEVTALQAEQDLRDLQNKADADFRRSQQAENSYTNAQRKYDNLLKESKERESQFTNEKLDLERRLRTTSGQKSALEEERDDALEQLSTLERESTRSRSELETRHATLQASFDQVRAELDSQSTAVQTVQRKLAQKEAEAGQLESEVLRLKSQGGDGELEKTNRQLSEQVTQIKRLEKTNRTQLAELTEFRKLHKSVNVVEEEKRALEGKLRLMDNLRTELASAQLRVQVLDEEKNSWTTFLENQSSGDDDSLKFDAPEDMARAFMQQRIENASLVERLGAVQPELNTKDEEIRELESARSKLQSEVEQLKTASGNAADSKAKARLERQKTLAIKETEYLRAQLKAFDDEEQEFHPERHSEEHARKIQDLQDLVDQYRKELDQTNAELSKAEKQQSLSPVQTGNKRKHGDDSDERIGELLRKNRKLQEDFNKIQTRNAVLDNEVKAQSKQLDSFKSSSSRTRILELRNNPTATVETIKQSTLDALQSENETLKAQLEGTLPTMGTSKDSSLVPKASLTSLQLTLQTRDQMLASTEKSLNRLRAIFAAKAHEFREAVFSLLGWKLEFQPNGRVKATSMFHPAYKDDEDGEGNFIVFDGENATMKVSGGTNSRFAKEIRGMIDHWVDGRGQVPCLLAAMTLEFYDRYGIAEGG